MRKDCLIAAIAFLQVCLSCQAFAQLEQREGIFTSAGLALHYTMRGQGAPVVLLSGGPGHEVSYMEPVAAMIAEHHTAILLEQRGTGRSMPAVLDAHSLNNDLLVADLESLRISLGYQKWTLLGHSFGTFTAMRYAIAHPAQTEALVLLAAVPPRSADDHFFDNVSARMTPQAKARLAELSRLESAASAEERAKLVSEEGMLGVAPYFFNVENAKPLLMLPDDPPTYRKVNALLFNEDRQYDLTPQLHSLKTRVLIVQGRQDPLDLEMAGHTRDALSGARLFILEQCGHFAWLEQREKLRQLLAVFLPPQAE